MNLTKDSRASPCAPPRKSWQAPYERKYLKNAGHGSIKPSWRSLFAFTTQQHLPWLLYASGASILAGFIKPTIAIFYGKGFGIMTRFGGGELPAGETLRHISIWCLGLTLLGVGAWVVEGALMSGWIIFGEHQARTVRQRLFANMLDKDIDWYDSREDGIGPFLIRMQTQIRELQLGASQPLGFLLFQLVASASSLGVAFYFSWKLTLVIIATFPFAAGALWLISRGLTPAIEAQKRELSRATKYANTAIMTIDTVKTFNAQDHEVWQYYSAIRKVTKHYMKQARANAAQFGVTKFLLVGIFVQGFWYGLYLVKGGLDPAAVFTTFYSCLSALQALEIMLPQILVLTKGMSAGETLKITTDQMKNTAQAGDIGGILKPLKFDGDIEINDVTFAYPSNPRRFVLNKATFFFPSGETTFVVGRSGCGKSTVGNILMRHYEQNSGEILIDGNSIKDLSADWLRKNITLVQQQSVLFNETIRQNIAFGRRDNPSNEDIEAASKTAYLEATIREMPDGFDTFVGSLGRSLSGGQTQRVALARARLRDAPFLILDESTSALDHRGRKEVMNAIRDWRKGKATVIITHDMSQIQDNDYVYVLVDGRVAEEGYRKKLAYKSHGTFASILRAEGSSRAPELALSSLPANQAIESPRWTDISDVFGTDDTALESIPDPASLLRANHRMSLGIGINQAIELKRHGIWSAPVIPQTPQVESSSPRWSLGPSKQFTSSRPAPPSQIQLENDEEYPATNTVPVVLRHRLPSFAKLKESPPDAAPTTLPPQYTSMLEPSEALSPSGMNEEAASITKILWTVWPNLNYKQRLIFILGFFAAFIVAAATPAFAYVFAKLVGTYFLIENQTSEATKWAVILLGIAVIDGIASFSTHYTLEYCGQAWVNALRLQALKRILVQPKSWFQLEEHSANRLNECLDRNAEEMRNLVGRFAGLVLTVALMLSISIIWAFIVSWQFTLVALACGPIFYIVTRIFHWVSKKWEVKCNRSADRSSSIFTETFTNIRVVRTLTLEHYFGRKHRAATKDTYKTGLRRAAYTGLLFGLLDSASLFIIALSLYYAGILITKGSYTVTEMMHVTNLFILGLSNASGMISMIPQISSSCTTATQMLYLANLPLTYEGGPTRLATPFPIIATDLSFTYPHQPTPTLSSISFTIRPGTCTAIVGPSGSGKSTITSLLQGLYTPSRPFSLRFANHPVQECNMTTLRSFISVVPQATSIFPATILSNILYGLPESSPLNTLSNAQHAANLAGIHEFISSLSQSYETLIGEGGQGLSGGQAQRIAIARALARHPKVLIMDEATSALDSESAEQIKACVTSMAGKGMAVVMVSHRVEMMKIAHHILVVEAGRIVEEGKFDELKRRGGALVRLIGGARGVAVEVEDEETMTSVEERSRDS